MLHRDRGQGRVHHQRAVRLTVAHHATQDFQVTVARFDHPRIRLFSACLRFASRRLDHPIVAA